jgi:SAM-dependent methyltransferase
MTLEPLSAAASQPYVGGENLEVMDDAHNYNGWLADMAAASFRPGDALLDFGAGRGVLTRLLRDRGFNMTALEPDDAMARGLEAQGFRTVRSLASVADESFRGIVTFNVLEHIHDDAGTVAALRRKVGRGGRVFVYVPAFPLLYSSMDRQVGHVRRYRRRGLRGLFERSGFRIDACRHADSIGFLAALAYRWLGSRKGILDPHAVRFYDRFVFPVSRVSDLLTRGTFGKNLILMGTAT